MIIVRRCQSRTALATFLLPVCSDDLRRVLHHLPITPELLVAALASWDIVEFFDTEKDVLIGAAVREPNHHVHIYVDSSRRMSWSPHVSLQAALDIFLSDSDKLYAAIPLADRTTIKMISRLGFIHTKTEDGVAFHVVTPQTRTMFDNNKRERVLRRRDLRLPETLSG